jgi:UDP-N-acetylmuramyl pentapeptide synthase
VAQEEGWLAELLPADGKLFLNGDGEWPEKIAARTKAKVVRVGLGEKNDWRATKIRLDKNGVTFQVVAPKEEFCGEYRVNLLGRHQVTNALLAISVGRNSDWAARKFSAAWPNASRRKCGCSFGRPTACACWTIVTMRMRIR